jgi:membrane glycosyltransferase
VNVKGRDIFRATYLHHVSALRGIVCGWDGGEVDRAELMWREALLHYVQRNVDGLLAACNTNTGAESLHLFIKLIIPGYYFVLM